MFSEEKSTHQLIFKHARPSPLAKFGSNLFGDFKAMPSTLQKAHFTSLVANDGNRKHR